jgi:hypothetical protein
MKSYAVGVAVLASLIVSGCPGAGSDCWRMISRTNDLGEQLDLYGSNLNYLQFQGSLMFSGDCQYDFRGEPTACFLWPLPWTYDSATGILTYDGDSRIGTVEWLPPAEMEITWSISGELFEVGRYTLTDCVL